MTAKTQKMIQKQMKAAQANHAVGFLNAAGDLLTVEYAATREAAQTRLIENLPRLKGDMSKWIKFEIAV